MDNRSIEQRFWEKVNKTSTCWIWTSANDYTYGLFSVKGKRVKAHRFSWELHNGPIPKGKGYHGICVCHKCDIPLCVNPNHLFLGTNKDNMIDRNLKKRHAVMKGIKNPKCKLTESQVLDIRSRPIYRGSQPVLAKEFGVVQSVISAIITRKIWRHI